MTFMCDNVHICTYSMQLEVPRGQLCPRWYIIAFQMIMQKIGGLFFCALAWGAVRAHVPGRAEQARGLGRAVRGQVAPAAPMSPAAPSRPVAPMYMIVAPAAPSRPVAPATPMPHTPPLVLAAIVSFRKGQLRKIVVR